jgi:4-aminobutyrate aminotransferase-like enzyme
LHWTIELHGPDWRDWRGEEAEPLASRVAARALDAGALIATSGEITSLFLAPPLISEEDDLRRIVDALDHGLAVADAEASHGVRAEARLGRA